MSLLIAVALAACHSQLVDMDRPPAAEPSAELSQLRQVSFVVDVDRKARLIRVGQATGRSGGSFSLVGGDAIALEASNLLVTGVGSGGAPTGKVLVKFDLAITNLLNDATLIGPNLPVSLDPDNGIYLIPLESVPTLTTRGESPGDHEVIVELPNQGGVVPGTDFDGEPRNLFNRDGCGASSIGCLRYEPYPALPGRRTSGPRSVGFVVDPTVSSFRTRFVVAGGFAPGPPPPPASFVFTEDFDDDSLASGMSVWNTVPAGPPPEIVDDATARGGRSLRIDWTGGTENDRGARVAVIGGTQPVVDIKFHYKLPADADLSGLLTLIRFRGPQDQAIGSLYISDGQWLFREDDLGDSGTHLVTGPTPAECKGQWCWIDMSLDYSSGTSVRAMVWINGTEALEYSSDGIVYAEGIASVQVWGHYSAPASGRSEWVDELAVGPSLPVTPPPGQVYFADKFDSGDKTKQANGWKWLFSGSMPVVSGIPTLANTSYAMQATYNTGNTLNEQRFQMGQNLTELYFGFYIHYPSNYFHRTGGVGANNNKLFRAWSGDMSQGNQGYNHYAIKGGFSTFPWATGNSQIGAEHGYAPAACSGSPNVGLQGTGPTHAANFPLGAGQWYKVQGRLRASSGFGINDGVLQLWVNGVQVLNFTGVGFYSRCTSGPRSNNYFNHGYLLGATNSHWEYNQIVYLTRVRFASTLELSDPDLSTDW